jgi:hypothetical protein
LHRVAAPLLNGKSTGRTNEFDTIMINEKGGVCNEKGKLGAPKIYGIICAKRQNICAHRGIREKKKTQ